MYANLMRKARPLATALPVAALSMLLGTTHVAAQGMPEGHPDVTGSPDAGLIQQVQAKRAEIENLNQQLMEIQSAAMEANPGLARQRDELVSFVDEKMQESGYDAAASRDRIAQLQGELQGGELSAEEEQQRQQDLRAEMGSMQQAHGQVMQDEEFLTRRQALNEDLVAAMQEQDPQTESLIADLEEAQQEYQELARQAMEQHGMGGPR